PRSGEAAGFSSTGNTARGGGERCLPAPARWRPGLDGKADGAAAAGGARRCGRDQRGNQGPHPHGGGDGARTHRAAQPGSPAPGGGTGGTQVAGNGRSPDRIREGHDSAAGETPGRTDGKVPERYRGNGPEVGSPLPGRPGGNPGFHAAPGARQARGQGKIRLYSLITSSPFSTD